MEEFWDESEPAGSPSLEAGQHGHQQRDSFSAVPVICAIAADRAATRAVPEHLGDGIEESPLARVGHAGYRATGKLLRTRGYADALDSTELRADESTFPNGVGQGASRRAKEPHRCDKARCLVDV